MGRTDREFDALIQRDADERREIRTLRDALERERNASAELRAALEVITEITDAVVEPPKWLQPKAGKPGHATFMLAISDTHFDEVTQPEAIDNLNKYDRAIAERRLKFCFEHAIRISRENLSGVIYDGAMVPFLGDMFSGRIHDELTETNADTPYGSIVHWIEYVAAGLRLMADHFGRVHCPCVIGNHGRSSKKPRHKLATRDNLDWLFYKVLAREFKDDPRVTFQIPEGPDAQLTLYNTRYLFTHGNQFRGGSGIAAALSPLLLGTHRKTRRQSAAGHPYDVMVMGHFHQLLPLINLGLLVCPSLKGYDEYAYDENLTPDMRHPDSAAQAFWLTTPEHGVVFADSLFVADRKAEGW